jgi:excisionase family DNA binding protein
MAGIGPTDLLTTAELAKVLGVSTRTIWEWYACNRIPGRKWSHRTLRFSLADVVAALDRGSVKERGRKTKRKPPAKQGLPNDSSCSEQGGLVTTSSREGA